MVAWLGEELRPHPGAGAGCAAWPLCYRLAARAGPACRAGPAHRKHRDSGSSRALSEGLLLLSEGLLLLSEGLFLAGTEAAQPEVPYYGAEDAPVAFPSPVLSTASTSVCSPTRRSHTAPVDPTSGALWREVSLGVAEDSDGLVPLHWPVVTAELKGQGPVQPCLAAGTGQESSTVAAPLASPAMVLQRPGSSCRMQPPALGESRAVSHGQKNSFRRDMF